LRNGRASASKLFAFKLKTFFSRSFQFLHFRHPQFCVKILWLVPGWPDWANFRLFGDCFLLAVFLENYKSNLSPHLFLCFFSSSDYILILTNKWTGLHFWRFFYKLIWSPWLVLTRPDTRDLIAHVTGVKKLSPFWLYFRSEQHVSNKEMGTGFFLFSAINFCRFKLLWAVYLQSSLSCLSVFKLIPGLVQQNWRCFLRVYICTLKKVNSLGEQGSQNVRQKSVGSVKLDSFTLKICKVCTSAV
jgi:hypothetical protein